MALTFSTQTPMGSQPKDFDLISTTGRRYSLSDFKGKHGLLVVFMCNHCPYVIAVQERLQALASEFIPKGIDMIGINSNDTQKYKDDSLEEMKRRALTIGYTFPYCLDETQEVARAYDAVCTPDPYLYAKNPETGLLNLVYRGRIDDSWKDPSKVKSRDLRDAMIAILSNEKVSPTQIPSMGCSIKWRT